MGSFWRDVRFALRTLARHRPTTAVSIVVLALGIGANIAIFSAVDAVLIRSSIPNADRFVVLEDTHSAKGLLRRPLPPARFLAWRQRPELFSGVAAYDTFEQTLSGPVEPQLVRVARVTPDLLALAGVTPSEGRLFAAMDEPAGSAVALVSRSFWRSRVGDVPVAGRSLRLDGETFSIIGAMPPGFDQPLADVYVPLRLSFPESRVARHLHVIAHLADGVSVSAAREQVRQVATEFEAAYPQTDEGWTTTVRSLREATAGDVAAVLRLLAGAAALVLLIACATVAGLRLVQGVARQREFGVRMALGATAGRVQRQLLTEAALIVMAGGVAATVLAAWIVPMLPSLGFARFTAIQMGGRVLFFACLVTAAAGLVSGVPPALVMAGRRIARGLSPTVRGAGDNPGARLRESIVVAQIALAVILTAGAALLSVSLWNLTRVDPGFRSDRVLTGQVTFPRSRYSGSRLRRFEQDLTARVAALPGVAAAGVVNSLPLAGRDTPFNFIVEHRPAETHGAQLSAEIRVVSPGYFEAMAIPVIAGRALNASDEVGARPVLVVNQSMARRFWPNGEPMGRRISLSGPEGPWITVVGVVGDVKHTGLAAEPRPEMYLPFQQETWPSLTIVVRSAIDAAAVTPSIRAIVADLDPELALYNVQPLDAVLAGALKQPRLQSLLVGAFATLALLLSAVGVFGVMAHSVSRRIPEMAIRLALGSGKGAVLTLVMRQGLRLIAAGLMLGSLCSVLLVRVLSSSVFGVRPNDPGIFAATLAVVSIVALAASYVPARWAANVDPAVALRGQ